MATSYLTNTWRYIHEDIFQQNNFLFVVLSQFLLTTLTMIVLGGAYTYVDLTGRPGWMLKYRVQNDKHVPIDLKRFWKVLRVAVRNFLLINLPFSVVLYALQRQRGCLFSADHMPSAPRFLSELVGLLIVEEIGFYYFHRLLHWGPLYRSVHKQHHEWTAPSALTAVYAHPLEHLLANVMPFSLGGPLVSAHYLTQTVWYVIALSSTLHAHSGYHLPFVFPSPQRHDYHHLKFHGNYGSIGLLDWLHGTDQVFRDSVQYKRHRPLLQLKPIDQLFPDKQHAAKHLNGHVD